MAKFTIECSILCLVAFGTLVSARHTYELEDEVKFLPGLHQKINFRHYSGYLNVSNGKFLHYWFVESQNNPLKDPVVLWLNGGPGCSSLDGLLTELGPFHIKKDKRTVYLNPYSWNKVANVIFLEAPAGVGFSYSLTEDYKTDDDQTAEDNYAALKHFFHKFPQFAANDFYITGESYGGIYVPTLAVLVLTGRAHINFKGFAIGNAALDMDGLGSSLIFFAYYHGLVDETLWSVLTDSCCGGNATRQACNFIQPSNTTCMKAVGDTTDAVTKSGLNVYNLYADCAASADGPSRDSADLRNIMRTFSFLNMDTETPPCLDSRSAVYYLNQKSVREALHIPPFVQDWGVCSVDVENEYKRIYSTVRPHIKKLLKSKKLKGLIYNGDADMACNFLGDEWFTEDLKLPVLQDYRPWYYRKQVAGFYKMYENLTFLTVKGSGHMVPGDKPAEALKMITSFLFNKPYASHNGK